MLSPSSSAPINRFTLFPHLPAELRLKIYTTISHQTPTPRILKITYSPSQCRYISGTAPPVTLSINSESRAQGLLSYTNLALSTEPSNASIPICWDQDTLYIAALSPLLSMFGNEFMFHLSTSASRHLIRSLAIDLRVWNDLCENGFLGVLGRMKGLREVCLVVEFGRKFEGELGFLDAPEWRRDLRWVAQRAGREVGGVRENVGNLGGKRGDEVKRLEDVVVRCVILTKGGEQA